MQHASRGQRLVKDLPWARLRAWRKNERMCRRLFGTEEIAFPLLLPLIAIYEVFETQGEVRVLRIERQTSLLLGWMLGCLGCP